MKISSELNFSLSDEEDVGQLAKLKDVNQTVNIYLIFSINII
jgi:hypothetical protein